MPSNSFAVRWKRWSLEFALADDVIASDLELDAEHAVGRRRLITRGLENSQRLDTVLEAAFVLRSLERIGDHARNVARYLKSFGPVVASNVGGQERTLE